MPDQELQPTFSSSINIETQEDIRYDNAVVIGREAWRMSDNQCGTALQFQACGFE